MTARPTTAEPQPPTVAQLSSDLLASSGSHQAKVSSCLTTPMATGARPRHTPCKPRLTVAWSCRRRPAASVPGHFCPRPVPDNAQVSRMICAEFRRGELRALLVASPESDGSPRRNSAKTGCRLRRLRLALSGLATRKVRLSWLTGISCRQEPPRILLGSDKGNNPHRSRLTRRRAIANHNTHGRAQRARRPPAFELNAIAIYS